MIDNNHQIFYHDDKTNFKKNQQFIYLNKLKVLKDT